MRNKKNSPSPSLLRALVNYSALGGALIGSMNQAQATIQYATLSGTPMTDGTFVLPSPAGTFSFKEVVGNNSALLYLGGGASVSGGTWYPFPLNANVPVNSAGAWQNAATQFLAWGPPASGYFAGAVGKFIAFRFNSGGLKYGWIRLDVAPDASSMTLIDWAYEDDGSPILTGQTAPFPIELLSFDLSRTLGEVDLSWTTTQEENFAGFAVERTDGGGRFTEVAWIAGQGTGNGPQNYTFRDQTAIDNQRYYYRLKMVDLDGGFRYSRLVEASIRNPGYAISEPYPNPVRGESFQLDIQAAGVETVRVQMFSAIGERVYERKTQLVQGQNTLSIGVSGLAGGAYFLKVEGRYYHAYKKLVIER